MTKARIRSKEVCENLYKYLQEAENEGWKIERVNLAVDKNMYALLIAPEFYIDKNLLIFFREEGHIVTQNVNDFVIREVFLSNGEEWRPLKAKSIIIYGENESVLEIVISKQQQGGGDSEVREAHNK